MSDRDDLDLDAAFDRLCADVDSIRARDADQAIRSGRLRRLAGAGVALAVATILAVILVGTVGLPGNLSVPTVAVPASDSLPAPRAFDATAFNQAAAGWTSGWTEGASPVPTELTCDTHGYDLPKPLDSSTTEFRAGPRIGATHTVERFATPELLRDSRPWYFDSDSCGGEFTGLQDEMWNGGESVAFAVETEQRTVYRILVLHESELAILTVAGADDLPNGVRKQLVLALLADLRT